MLHDTLRKRPAKDKYISDNIQTDTVYYFGTKLGHNGRGACKSILDPSSMEVWTEGTLIGKSEANNILEVQT
jgi:hypothetical protein